MRHQKTRHKLSRDAAHRKSLLQKSESELAAIPNFGRKSIEEVIETLKSRGLELRAA